ncbi:hypothetical protein BC940DRAFT_321302 [Gongronella butleri]|nr:hypothetical protein BC940DRAFT_321302 [Gongronella butleri]
MGVVFDSVTKMLDAFYELFSSFLPGSPYVAQLGPGANVASGATPSDPSAVHMIKAMSVVASLVRAIQIYVWFILACAAAIGLLPAVVYLIANIGSFVHGQLQPHVVPPGELLPQTAQWQPTYLALWTYISTMVSHDCLSVYISLQQVSKMTINYTLFSALVVFVLAWLFVWRGIGSILSIGFFLVIIVGSVLYALLLVVYLLVRSVLNIPALMWSMLVPSSTTSTMAALGGTPPDAGTPTDGSPSNGGTPPDTDEISNGLQPAIAASLTAMAEPVLNEVSQVSVASTSSPTELPPDAQPNQLQSTLTLSSEQSTSQAAPAEDTGTTAPQNNTPSTSAGPIEGQA